MNEIKCTCRDPLLYGSAALYCTTAPAWICYCLDPSLDGSAIYCMDLNTVLICYNVDLLLIDPLLFVTARIGSTSAWIDRDVSVTAWILYRMDSLCYTCMDPLLHRSDPLPH